MYNHLNEDLATICQNLEVLDSDYILHKGRSREMSMDHLH